MADGSCLICGAPGRCKCEEGRGPWFTTSTRKRFYSLTPTTQDIDIRDIAHHLARITRWGGACDSNYSVAQHSVNVAAQLAYQGNRTLTMAGLLHDSPEAYMGDVVRPLKHETDWGSGYRVEEAKLARVIESKFGLPSGCFDWEEVKQADHIMLNAEALRLFDPPLPWAKQMICLVDVNPIENFRFVEQMFLAAFQLLGGAR